MHLRNRFSLLLIPLLLTACIKSSGPPSSLSEQDDLLHHLEEIENDATGGLDVALAPGNGPWYKVDLHTHSALSSDAYVDLGIMSEEAKGAGYNALFVTDHNQASSFPISGLTANHMVFEDSYTRWYTKTFGSLGTATNTLASAPVNTGTAALRLASTSSSYAESFVWTNRGPNLRSGDIILKVSIYPTRLDSGSSVFVSVAVGGDPTVRSPYGYTTTDGVVHPSKSTVLVWQLGSGKPPSADPNARVITNNLGAYTLNQWNTYTVNVSSALAAIPAADRPIDSNGVADLKLAVASSGGSADAYFDTYSIDASAPVADPAKEFIARNSVLASYDTPTFKLFPSIEYGVRRHANRFNFGIGPGQENQFTSYYNGVDGIAPTQATGYIGQLNHPASSGGVSAAEAVSNQAYGADQMEVNREEQVGVWDDILKQNVVLLGISTTDKHTASYSSSSSSSFVYAAALEFDVLMKALFEGRSSLSEDLSSQLILNFDSSSAAPYPARYPVFVSDALTSTELDLTVPVSAGSGATVRWVSGGAQVATDAITGSVFKKARSIALTGSKTYVRAEVRNSSGVVRALTQPIFFYDVPGLPTDKTLHVETVTTPNGQGYTRNKVQGMTGVAWDTAAKVLSLTLVNPSGSLVEMRGASSASPSSVKVGGAAVSAVGSISAFNSATGSAWFYDGATQTLYLKALHAASSASVTVGFGGAAPAPDSSPPTVPTNLQANAVSPQQVDLSWTASTDNTGVTGYELFRDGSSLATVENLTSYADTSVQPGAAYRYQVRARDAVGNWSPLSNAASAMTPGGASGGTRRFSPAADTYVRSDYPDKNYGGSSSLSADGSPSKHTLLRFEVTGLAGKQVTNATLRLYNTNASAVGGNFYRVSDNGWDEASVSWNTAPPSDSALVASLGRVASGTWYEVNVSSVVSGDGPINFKITSTSSDGADYGSRESSNKPELVITTSDGGTGNSAPTARSQSVSTAQDGPATIDLSGSDGDGDCPLAFSITTQPGHGSLGVLSTLQCSSGAGSARVVYTPGAGFSGTDSFTFSVTDPSGASSGAVTVNITVTQAQGGGGTSNTLTFSPAADAYVRSDYPDKNYGGSSSLSADGSPTRHSLLKFDVSGLGGQVLSATLRLYNTNASAVGGDVYWVSDATWNEGSVTWNTAPPHATFLASLGRVSSGNWYEVDVTPLVTGNGPVSLKISSTSSDGAYYGSKESSTRPELVVTQASP